MSAVEKTRPNVLVIAGYDPSGGAGVLADAKTMEAHGVYAWSVCTCLTFQNEKEFTGIRWFSEQDILMQIDMCLRSASFGWVKIGIVHSLSLLDALIRYLKAALPDVKIILDPVIRSSSGMDIQPVPDASALERVAGSLYAITPNWNEISWIYPGKDVLECCRQFSISSGCRIFLKGGHHPSNPGTDYLWEEGVSSLLEPAAGIAEVWPKHGSGCVLASSLTANLALGYPFAIAAERAKRYIEKFLTSNQTLLGWH